MNLLFILITALAWRPFGVAAESKATAPKKSETHSKEKPPADDKHDHNENEGHEEHGAEKHEEHKEEKHSDHEGEKHSDHESEKHEEHGDEHGESESKVGPGKGIEAASEELGIKLSPQAAKNFEITTMRVSSIPVAIPRTSLLFLAEDVEVYRLRDGFFKRIDFKKISDTPLRISSSDLKAGDEIVTNGVGFIRIAEVAAFGGAPEGHAH